MKLTVLGSGDAFSSGGRLPSCYALEGDGARLLLDCGPSILLALKREGLSSNDFSHIVISHLHGDHIAGLPFFLIDAIFNAKRDQPLTIAGPAGSEVRFRLACELFYPRILGTALSFELNFIEMEREAVHDIDGFNTTPYEVNHFSGSPSFALRFERGGKTFAFSGDAGWSEALIRAGRGADLYLMECYLYDVELPMHLNYLRLAGAFEAIGARKIMLTHMAEPMLARRDQVDRSRFSIAEDGLVAEI